MLIRKKDKRVLESGHQWLIYWTLERSWSCFIDRISVRSIDLEGVEGPGKNEYCIQ